MKKRNKIITIVLSIVMCASVFTISSFAYTYVGESGNSYEIPNEFDGILHDIPEIDFDNAEYTNGKYPLYTYKQIYAEGTRLDDNCISNDYYQSDSRYAYYERPTYVEVELPNLSEGKYTVSFDLSYRGKGIFCMPEDDLLLLKSPNMGNFLTFLSLSYEDVENWYYGTIYNFYSDNGCTFKFELVFDFDANLLECYIYDLNSLCISYERSLSNFDDKSLPIRLRYQIQSDRYANLDWQATYIENFKFSFPPSNLTDDELAFIETYIREIEKTEGNIKWQQGAVYSEEIYKDEVDELEKEVTSLNSQVSSLNKDLSSMEEKYENAKEGLENTNAVSNFFQGCYEAVHGVLMDIFGLEVWGFNFGSIVAILLGAFFVIFILKLVF